MITQYLILIIIGTFIGIGLVLSIVRSVMSGIMGGSMMGGGGYYQPRYYGSNAAALGLTFVFVFLLAAVMMASRIQNGKSLLPERTEQKEKNYEPQQKAPAPEENTYPDNDGLFNNVIPAGILINQSPRKNRLNQQPSRETGPATGIYGYTPSTKERETPATYGHTGYNDSGSYYLQAEAGNDHAAASSRVRQLAQRLGGQAWLGYSPGDSPYKVLIGPYSSRQKAQEANRRLGLKGYPRNIVKDGIELLIVE